MRIPKYILSALLVIWGLFIAWTKLFSVGIYFPFLTVLTALAVVSGISKYNKADFIFLTSACLWILFSAETIGFVIFFDPGNYERMIVGLIPLSLGSGLLFSVKSLFKLSNTLSKKLFLIPVLATIGIGSHIYKSTIEEVNCWYYPEEGEIFKARFAETPNRTFEVELSSNGLKGEVKAEALQYEGRRGYYCPETKVRVVTSFGKIVSAKILSFRNSEIDKKVTFSNQMKIPLDKVNGKLEILQPYMLRLWN